MPANWQPAASFDMLRRRAGLLTQVRSFFAERGVLEVETPLLAAHATTDLHLHSFELRDAEPGLPRFLQTSPEYAMKRLLAAGSGPIFQLGRAFRAGERGRLHNPEFTILEWYRPGFDHHALMDEVEMLLAVVAGTGAAERIAYGPLLETRVGVDPHRAGVAELADAGRRHGIDIAGGDLERDAWLDLLMTHVIEPTLGCGPPTFVYDYPASQAALARLRGQDGVEVAERFEVYLEGTELANGFNELADPAEQRRRFESDRAQRRARGLPVPKIDERLLAALDAGLGDCAGVALGIDRLLMVMAGAGHIDEVLAFPADRA